MNILKRFLVLFLVFISSFTFLASTNANELDDIFRGLELIVDESNNKTPLEKAKKELEKYEKGTYFISIIDNFVNSKKSDTAYLKRISVKVKAFDLSKYNSSNSNKNLTLRAVITYIDLLLDQTIANNING